MSGTCAENGALLAGWSFTYDGDGSRVKGVYTDGTSSLTTYYFGGGAYEVQDDGTNTSTRVYYAFAGMTIAMAERDTGTPGTVTLSYFLTDHLGSVVAVTDDTGALLSEQRYLPFGQVRTDVDGITQTDFGYTGQRDLDAQENAYSLGLMDYKARFYSPLLGRFVQPDSIIPNPMNPQAFNRYSYVINNPIRFTDPTGRTPCEGDNWDDGPRCLKNKNSILSTMVANAKYQRDCAAGVNGACPGGTRGMLAFGAEAILTVGLLEYGLLGGGIADALIEGVRTIKAVGQTIKEVIKNALGLGAGACATNPACEQKAVTTLTSYYPPNRGFKSVPQEIVLKVGDLISRYGSETGRFFSPADVPAWARSLSPDVIGTTERVYEVTQPFTVYAGPASPWFGQAGGGMQYYTVVFNELFLRNNGFINLIP